MTPEQILADIKNDRRKKVILDCDTANEMDDQYAVAYVLGRPDRFELLAMTAEHHSSRGNPRSIGMEESYDEFFRVMKVCHKEGACPVYRGAPSSMCEDALCRPVMSEASDAIVRLANEAGEILYIIATGPVTNIAAAISADPSIIDKICVIWLGGNCYEWDSASECNVWGDCPAAQVMMNSGVMVVQLPAFGAEDHGTVQLRITRDDFMENLAGDSDASVFFRETLPCGLKRRTDWEDHVIWDIAGPCVLTLPEAYEFSIVPAPIFTDNIEYRFDDSRHKIIYMERLDPKTILEDMYRVIRSL